MNVHCFAWGTITTIIGGGGMSNGASPANGMSVQRVSNTYVVAAPMPNAANSNGMVDMPMVDGPPPPRRGRDRRTERHPRCSGWQPGHSEGR